MGGKEWIGSGVHQSNSERRLLFIPAVMCQWPELSR
ncbi:MAG: hypothetical protein QOD40_633, partial [Alphaproteobacteria bacterium]|nr:hypothetical protein [Alphaproteobacteria bacterium]